MTDPNVVALLELLTKHTFRGSISPERDAAVRLMALLAAAEKPAEVERCPNHHKDGRCSLDDGHAGDHVAKWGDTGAEIARWPRRLSDLGRDAEKPAETAPVVPRYEAVTLNQGGSGERYGVRDRGTFSISCELRADADKIAAVLNRVETAAPTVAAVKFNEDSDAEGDECGDALDRNGEVAALGYDGWEAEHDPKQAIVSLRLRLRPGEDAGETLAKILAACGRTA